MAARAGSVLLALALAGSLSPRALGLRSHGGFKVPEPPSEDCPHTVHLVGEGLCADGETGKKVALECCDCPRTVHLIGKGMCADGETGKQVALECCDEILQCRTDVASASEAVIHRISTYQLLCGASVHATTDDTIETEGRDRLCEPACMAAIAELGQRVDAESVLEHCRSIEHDQGLDTLETLVPLVRALDAAFGECDCPVKLLLEAIEQKMSVFQLKCQLPEAASLLIGDDHKELLCSAECQAAEELAAALPDDAAVAAKADCTAAHADRLNRVFAIVADLDSQWRGCKAEAVSKPEARADPSMRHYDCGYYGINQEGCEALGCTWDPSNHGTNWCYEALAAREARKCTEQCPKEDFPRAGRSDCSWFNSTHPDDDKRGRSCEAVGCCWQPLEHNSAEPWCFHQPCL